MYRVEIEESEKVFLVTMSGIMTKPEIMAYIDEFKKKTKRLNPAEYSIVLNIQELEVVPGDFNVTDLMEQAVILTINVPFKMRYNTMPKSVVATWLIEKIGKKDTSFYDTIFTESYGEVLKLLRVKSIHT